MRSTVLTVLVLGALLAAPLAPVGATPPAPTTPAYAVYPAPAHLGGGAGEPSIGVNWNTGNVLLQAFTRTLRASFDDSVMPPVATWTDVTPVTSRVNIDPILFTDSVSGRTFAGGLAGPCSVMSYTDDDGASWTQMANPCVFPAFDHESVAGGPWRGAPPAGAVSSRAVYYCAHSWHANCATSLDGGITFGAPMPVLCGGATPAHHGSAHVGQDGYVYVPFKNCGALFVPAGAVGLRLIGGHPGVSISADNGRTFTGTPIPSAVNPGGGFDPDVATTPSGWVYVAYANNTGETRVALSKNHGGSWAISPALGSEFGLVNTTFHEIVAGDDARAAVAFLGTTGTGNAFGDGFTGTWHLYVSTTLDAGATWTTIRVTDDPVQRGCIWDEGGTHACRNLLDFMDAQVDEDGRVVVGFADGCRGACAEATGTHASPKSDFATIARQACGPSLFAAKGNLEGALACSTTLPAAPPPVPLSGTYYARSALLVGNAGANPGANLGGQPDADSRVLSPDAPTSTVPSVQSSFPGLGATVTGTALAAQWALPAPEGGWALDGATVTVRLFVGGEGALVQRINVSLYDAGVGLARSSATPASIANQTATIPTGGAAPQEVVLTFTGITRTLARGFAVVVETQILGDAQVYYDAVDFPTRVEIS